MKPRHAFPILFAALAVCGAATAPSGARWWGFVRELASDKYQGRATASPGYRQAAEMVSAEFKKLGLVPAEKSGYMQPVPLTVRKIREPESSLSLVQGGLQEVLEMRADAYINLNIESRPQVDAPAVFVGYGLTVPEAGYDDLAGIDLKGRVAVFLRGGPSSIPGPLRAHYQTLGERQVFLRKAGAVGIAAILDPRSMDLPWERYSANRLEPFMSLAAPGMQDGGDLALSITINPARADKWFAGTEHTFAEILDLAKAGRPLPRFPLARSVHATVSADRSETECENVAAVLRGADPRLRDEYVVISAHLDHLGAGVPVNGDSIYNGAMDDASGVASLIEIARALKASPPRRSVLFLAVTGEEKGLLGSRYFASHPSVPAASIVADLNLDMFLPIHTLRVLTVYGLAESSLGNDIQAAAKAYGVGVQADPEPDRNIFIRSDQYSFIREGVPSLMFEFGSTPGSPEERLQRQWLNQRYHAPSDDAMQPVNLAAAARFNRIVAALARRVANKTARPVWSQNSFFRRFADGLN
jgi:hypothetical protein